MPAGAARISRPTPPAAQSLDAAVALLKDRGGRAYSGLAASWGGQLQGRRRPVLCLRQHARNVPAVAFLYHSMALTADIMVRFNEWNPEPLPPLQYPHRSGAGRRRSRDAAVPARRSPGMAPSVSSMLPLAFLTST